MALLTFDGLGIRQGLAALLLALATTSAFAAGASVELHEKDRLERTSLLGKLACFATEDDLGIEQVRKLDPLADPNDEDRFLSRFGLAAGASSTYYVQMAADFPQRDELHLSDLRSFEQQRERSNLIDGLVYSLLLITLICNVVLTLAFRERMYLFNLMECFFGLATLVVLNSHARRYLPSGLVPHVHYFCLALPALWSMFSAKFANSFLDLPRCAPAASKLMGLIQMLALAVVVLGFAQQIQLAYLTLLIIGTLGPVTGVYGATRAYRQGFTPAKWYLLGVFILFASVVGVLLTGMGFMREAWASERLEFSITLACIVFTLALGSRIRLLRDLSRISALRLHDQSNPLYVDRLSGAKNALGWSRLMPSVLAHGANAALITIHFEGLAAFEQTHGEASYGELLRQLAGCIGKEMGEHDLQSRTSKDEFNVLLTDVPDQEILAVRVEIILDSLENPVDVHGEIFAARPSAGVAFFPLDGVDPDSLTRAANYARNFVRDHGGLGYALHRDVVAA